MIATMKIKVDVLKIMACEYIIEKLEFVIPERKVFK